MTEKEEDFSFKFARFMERGFRGDRLKSVVTTGRGLVTCSCIIRGMDT